MDLDLDELDTTSADLPPDPRRARAIEEIRSTALAPMTILLFGRVGVGKTTIANLASGARHPVGLNGVTRSVTRSGIWLDTPGINDPVAAIDVLGPLVEVADGLVWVVDGLQPLPASEREVADAILPRGLPLVVAITRRDLIDPSDQDEVLARVRAKTSVYQPERIEVIDGRQDPLAPPDLTHAPRWLRLRASLQTLRDQEPIKPSLDEVIARWRLEVRSEVETITSELVRAPAARSADAQLALAETAPRVVARTCHFAQADLPLPAPQGEWLGGVLDELAGTGGAVRALRAGAARWLAAGEVALREDWAGRNERERERCAYSRFVEVLDRALAERRI